jgi:glycine betaine/proline transport system substrate-binding protein
MKFHSRGTFSNTLVRGLAAGALTLAATTGMVQAEESKEVRFGVQPWPGVTVKTEVFAQMLEAAGYDVDQKQLNTPLTLEGLSNGDLEAGFGGWYPISSSMIDPLVQDGEIERLSANLEGALSGVAVPTYVRDAGVESMSDLNEYADRFDRKIYGIESGSTWNTGVKEAIKENRHDLGEWELVSSGTTAMLAQVGRATQREDWVAFYGWRPHWMNIKYDMHYLEAPDDSEIAHTESTVYTLTRNGLEADMPNVNRFLSQYSVEPETQSRWIYEHSYNERPEDEVAREWIEANPERVREWLEGIKTVDGEPAFEAVKAEYDL